MDGRDGRWVIWPERRFIPAEELIAWARDAVANGVCEGPFDGSVEEAVTILDDAGFMTFTREGTVPSEMVSDVLRRLGLDD